MMPFALPAKWQLLSSGAIVLALVAACVSRDASIRKDAFNDVKEQNVKATEIGRSAAGKSGRPADRGGVCLAGYRC